MTKTIEILTINLLEAANKMEHEGWSVRFIVLLGPKSIVVLERMDELVFHQSGASDAA